MRIVVCALLLFIFYPLNATATGESCGAFDPCSHSHDYCRFVSLFSSVCTERGDAGDGCTGISQGTCKSGLLCDITGVCRHNPPENGEPCGIGVSCASGLVCSADIGGVCGPRGGAGDACSGIGQGSCASGLVCDALRVCRHDPPANGEPCGTGVACASGLVCSADIGGVCGPRGDAGDSCSGIGQGSCEAGLVCDALRVCRHDPPQQDEPCGPFVPCDNGLFCQGGTQVCKRYKRIGEGCSAFNPCMSGLSCEACFTSSCDYPFQCFPNANQGVITQQQCLTIYNPDQHQAATDTGLAMTWAAGDGIAAGAAESQEFGVVYGPYGDYGCFTTLCAGISVDVSISAFVSVGFYDAYDFVPGSSTAFVEGAGAGVLSFSTSQIYARNSLDPFDIVGFPLSPIGTEDVLALTISPDDVVIPFNPGVYACETVVDTVIGGTGQPTAPICGNGILDAGEGCDDGNILPGDGCSGACNVEALCGNGSLDTGEDCDDGNHVDGDGCSATCETEAFCGDGNLDLGEECEPPGTADCSVDCLLLHCGNNIVEPQLGEECDDGNLASGDGCDQSCLRENQPPVAMCTDITASADASCQADASIDNGSSDPDGNLVNSAQNPAGPYILGTTTVTLTVTDSFGASDSCSAMVTVEDNALPVITAPGEITQECASPDGTPVTLGVPTLVTDNCDASPVVANDAPAVFLPGPTVVNWTATDLAGNIGNAVQTVTIVDTTPPELSVSVSPTFLWPPNHKMYEITPTVSASDTCDRSPEIELVSITMNESDNELVYDQQFDTTPGDGQTSNDIQYDSGTGQIFVRSERSGNGYGRVYTLTYKVTDAAGNMTHAAATVTVPHNQ